MNVAPPAVPTCSTCQTALDPNGTCPRCRAPEDWNDQIEATDFILRRLRDWQQAGQLTDRQLQKFTDLYEQRRNDMQSAVNAQRPFERQPKFPPRNYCWSCREYLYKSSSHCTECGAPVALPAVKSLRYWRYLQAELEKHEESGWLSLRQAHDLIGETQERIDGLQRKLERERAVMVIPVDESAPPPPPGPRRRPPADAEDAPVFEPPDVPPAPARSFMEVLLDPQTIQWLMLAGGVLIVVGLIIWMASMKLFENEGVIAVALGLGNAAMLAGGYFMILRTRFQNAGRGLTLLACMLMPLNLWFYDSHKMLTYDNNLWIAALGCCIIYTGTAFVLKDPLFVYVVVGGITLTGLLIMAPLHVFFEVLTPTIFLMILGLICLHSERAFPPGDGPFSRERFGMAFFWSAQALFAGGLLLLLGAQLIYWLYEAFFRAVMNRPVVGDPDQLPWTLTLVLVGTYAYVYSDLVVRKVGVYLYLAAITILWAEVQVLVLAGLKDASAVVIITFAVTGLVINVLQTQLESKEGFLRRAFPLGILLSFVPVMFGVLLQFRAVNKGLNDVWLVLVENQPAKHFVIEWPLVLAMAVTALCCRTGAFLYRHSLKEVSIFYFFLTAAATLMFAAGLAWQIGLHPWETQAPFLMVIPILYLVAANFYRGHTPEKPLIWCGQAATALMIACSLWAAVAQQVAERIEGPMYHFLLAGFCLEAALFYGLAGVLHRSQVSLYLAAVMFCGAVWQVLISIDPPHEVYPIAFSLTGFLLLILYRIGLFEKFEMPALDRGIYQSANALTTIGFVAGALVSMTRLFRKEDAPLHVAMYLLIFLIVISLASIWLVQHPIWRRVYIVMSIVNGILLLLVIHRLFNFLSPWQKLEIVSIIVGLVLLTFAYIGWYHETERASDINSMAFFFGSLAVVMPMFIAAIVRKFVLINPVDGHHFHEPGWNDLGIVIACIALFGSGVMCRIKSTTLIGASTMICFLMMIMIEAIRHLDTLWMTGIYLAIGGAVLFGTGLFLSMYRERLLELPARIKRREGIFRIFDWR